MTLIEREERNLPLADAPTTTSLYCMVAMVADEASEAGFRDFAKALEAAIDGFLASLPADQQADALRLSYELAMGRMEEGEAVTAPPRLRLVYSR